MNISVVIASKSLAKSEAAVIGVFEGDKGLPISSILLSGAARGEVSRRLLGKEFKGGRGENLALRLGSAGAGSAETIWAYGLGKREKFTAEAARKFGAAVLKKAKGEKWSTVTVDAAAVFTACGADGAQALFEGMRLADYKFDRYFSKKKNSNPLVHEISAVFADKDEASAARAALKTAEVISEGVTLARDFANEPPNVIYPQAYAERIRKACVGTDVTCQILDDKKIQALKMGGLWNVGKGSERKPRLVVLEYAPAGSSAKPPVVLVGKGVTFDTGGISLKPGRAMDEMKFDMCGSAAVVGAVITAAKLKLPVRVVGITPLAENMPDGAAQRPGDIITISNGKTVEVLNTDAEGRLILADALAYSQRFKPRYVVDIATLTGACAAFFDSAASGLMANDAELASKLRAAGEKTGERLWELPLWDEYEDFIKGSYGDIQNISRKGAGTITAGMFLKHFGGHSKWAHLDIAGTAWSQSAKDYSAVGATGIGVRLFVEFLRKI
jgi:leucyl aminopeptidase